LQQQAEPIKAEQKELLQHILGSGIHHEDFQASPSRFRGKTKALVQALLFFMEKVVK
jgi:hypothetical protein